MSDCWYCGKEVEYGYNYADPNVHKLCWDERKRRELARECVFCGNDLGDVDDIKHESCRVADTYSGYG